MNAKYPAKTSIKNWLESSSKILQKVGIESYKLDSELILSYVFNKNRTYLHAHNDMGLSKNQYIKANKMLQKRSERYPIAYILGQKEFYGRNFVINKNVLIPRPESESIINLLKEVANNDSENNVIKIIDVGCGSGCLGITAKLEIPKSQVLLIDKSKKALSIAKKNASNLKAQVYFLHNNLLSGKKIDGIDGMDVIIANLPYLDKSWLRSPETQYEPSMALFAKDNGMNLIKKLIRQSHNYIKKNGYLILEFEPKQRPEIVDYARDLGFNHVKSTDYVTALIKN